MEESKKALKAFEAVAKFEESAHGTITARLTRDDDGFRVEIPLIDFTVIKLNPLAKIAESNGAELWWAEEGTHNTMLVIR